MHRASEFAVKKKDENGSTRTVVHNAAFPHEHDPMELIEHFWWWLQQRNQSCCVQSLHTCSNCGDNIACCGTVQSRRDFICVQLEGADVMTRSHNHAVIATPTALTKEHTTVDAHHHFCDGDSLSFPA
jgi:hypothetical protein